MQSNPTQTLVSTRTTGLQKTNSQHVAAPATAPLVDVRDNQRNRLAFERSLDRISQSEIDRNERGDSDEQQVGDKPDRENEDGNQSQGDHDEDAKSGSEFQGVGRIGAALFTGSAPTMVTATMPMLSAEQLANLQRMAAAIAEVAKTGTDARMTIDFGSIGGLATGAVLGRDRNGALTVHLTGMPPFMSSAQLQSLRSELMSRLLRRKLLVSTVEYLDDPTRSQRPTLQADSTNQTPDLT